MPLTKKLKVGLVTFGLVLILLNPNAKKISNQIQNYERRMITISNTLRQMEEENVTRRMHTGENSLYSDPTLYEKYEKLKEEYVDLGHEVERLRGH